MTQWRRVENLVLCFVFAVVEMTTAAGLFSRHHVEFMISRICKVRRKSIGTAWSYTVPVNTAPVQTITKEEP
jgi:hypothetical protein